MNKPEQRGRGNRGAWGAAGVVALALVAASCASGGKEGMTVSKFCDNLLLRPAQEIPVGRLQMARVMALGSYSHGAGLVTCESIDVGIHADRAAYVGARPAGDFVTVRPTATVSFRMGATDSAPYIYDGQPGNAAIISLDAQVQQGQETPQIPILNPDLTLDQVLAAAGCKPGQHLEVPLTSPQDNADAIIACR